MDTRPLPFDEDDPTQIDRIPAPLQHALRAGLLGSSVDTTRRPSFPPPLPVVLERRRPDPLTDSDEAWLETLPPASRAVLEAARRGPAQWPLAPRVPNAIVRPVTSDA